MLNVRKSAIRIVFGVLASLLWGWFGLTFAADNIHWTVTGPNSVTVDWRGTDTAIFYGLTVAYGQSVTAVSQTGLLCDPQAAPDNAGTGPYMEARITGLSVDTVYHYKVGTGGADHTFHTPPPIGSADFTAVAVGDIGDAAYYHENVTAIQNMIAADLPDLTFALGDLTYKDAHGALHDINHFNDVMVWSQDSPYMPIWGNHEWQEPTFDDLRNYKGRFDLPNPQRSTPTPIVSDCGEDWYWFDYGNTRFIAYPEPAGLTGSTSTSAAWNEWYGIMSAPGSPMATAQADANIRFIVTFGHRPGYSSGHNAGQNPLKGHLDNLACQYGKYVLNLAAHSHNYERSFPQKAAACSNPTAPGVIHTVSGTGGASLEQDGACLWLTCTQPSWSAARFMRQGLLKLTFQAAGIGGKFLCGPAGAGTNDITCNLGDVIDTFTIGCYDADNDGYGASGDPSCPFGLLSDCDDSNPNIHPGAAQVCDGANNNCNAAGWPSLAGTNEFDNDGDGLAACLGDCNDANPSVYPGAPQVCDGLNNNCSAPGWPSLAGTAEVDADADGVSLCAGDCNEADPLVYRGAPDVNDGRDNQCPGDPGFGLIDESSGDGGFHSSTNPKTEYSWPAVQNATKWQVAKADSPDFSSGCLTSTTSAPKWTDAQVPAVGRVFYYLNRPVAPFVGSWGAHSAGAEWGPICPASGTSTFEASVDVGSDDAEETSSGTVRRGNEDLDLTYDGSNQTIGIRFIAVTIPHGARILNAWVQFEVRDVSSGATSLTIRAESGDNPPTFSTEDGDISQRSRTSAFASWNPPAWNVDDEESAAQQTPDLSAIVRELVTRPGWVSGNSVVIIISGSGNRSAKSWNYDSGDGSPWIHVEFDGGGQ